MNIRVYLFIYRHTHPMYHFKGVQKEKYGATYLLILINTQTIVRILIHTLTYAAQNGARLEINCLFFYFDSGCHFGRI